MGLKKKKPLIFGINYKVLKMLKIVKIVTEDEHIEAGGMTNDFICMIVTEKAGEELKNGKKQDLNSLEGQVFVIYVISMLGFIITKEKAGEEPIKAICMIVIIKIVTEDKNIETNEDGLLQLAEQPV